MTSGFADQQRSLLNWTEISDPSGPEVCFPKCWGLPVRPAGLGVAGAEWNVANTSSCSPIFCEHPPGNLPGVWDNDLAWPGSLLRAENLMEEFGLFS